MLLGPQLQMVVSFNNDQSALRCKHWLLQQSDGSYNDRCESRLLSEAIDALSGDLLGQMERDARGYPVKLLDVARGADIPAVLSKWEGTFTVSMMTACPQKMGVELFGQKLDGNICHWCGIDSI